MEAKLTIIHIHPHAPAKPAVGAPCNGCGVCCLVAPCPVGMILSRKRTGACKALLWNQVQNQYRCGLVEASQSTVSKLLPRYLVGVASSLSPALRWLAKRWIATGAGCDSDVEAAAPSLVDNQ